MNIVNSLLRDLLQELPYLRSQMYFKSALTALSHAMEDIVLAGADSPLVIANFQQERFYRQEVRRYRQIAQYTDQVYVLAAPESESGFAIDDEPYETIPLAFDDGLAQEWHLVILGQHYTACIVCREQALTSAPMDQMRRFEGIWTFDRQVSRKVAKLLLERIAFYRPELASKIEQAWQDYELTKEDSTQGFISTNQALEVGIFAQRLVTYLQASHYKLLKAYRVIAAQERQERLINIITVAMRASLNPQEILSVAVEELGQTFEHCRCILYRLHPPAQQTKIEYEFVAPQMQSLKGQVWSVADNPLFLAVQAQDKAMAINHVSDNPYLQANSALSAKIALWEIRSWLMVPIRYQGTLLGMLELHYGGLEPYRWREEDISLVEAIATQAGVALTQAQAFTNLVTLNRQLEALERTQSNLIAIVGHELRTPLSTIRVCLESLVSEPEMEAEFQQVMLDTALSDSERMRKLVQDFLTLSKLESGQAYRCPEPIEVTEILNLALSSLKTNSKSETLPKIELELPSELPLVRADGDGLVEVFSKLLDNACKFTPAQGQITIRARILNSATEGNNNDQPMLEVIIADTGRGIESSQLEAIFDRFYQEEDSLRRTVGGTGLGLAICRQIIENMGGQIWAHSAGKEQGSQFHFTIAIES